MSKIAFWHMARAAHAIGSNAYSQRSYDQVPRRNHYVGSLDDSLWGDLVEAGLATVESAPVWACTDALYRLTPKGVELTHAFLDLAARDRVAFTMEVTDG